MLVALLVPIIVLVEMIILSYANLRRLKMKGQLEFFKIKPSAENKLKRKWENAFQK